MHHLIILLLSAAAAASPLAAGAACTSTCPTIASTITKTHTKHSTVTATKTKKVFTATVTTTATATTTLTPGCPAPTTTTSATAKAKRVAEAAAVDAKCKCSKIKPSTVHTTVTSETTTTSTKTVETIKTVKHKTTLSATPTPSQFYLYSSYDAGYAINAPQGSYDLVTFTNPCSAASALFTFNTTSGQLIDETGEAAGWQSQSLDPTAVGTGFAFGPADIDYGNAPEITCTVGADEVLACAVGGGAVSSFESCGGTLLLGGSHLCDATTVTVVPAVYA